MNPRYLACILLVHCTSNHQIEDQERKANHKQLPGPAPVIVAEQPNPMAKEYSQSPPVSNPFSYKRFQESQLDFAERIESAPFYGSCIVSPLNLSKKICRDYYRSSSSKQTYAVLEDVKKRCLAEGREWQEKPCVPPDAAPEIVCFRFLKKNISIINLPFLRYVEFLDKKRSKFDLAQENYLTCQ